jgi:hypothetical protein
MLQKIFLCPRDEEYINLSLSIRSSVRFARQKKKILTLVLSENKFRNETKNHNPPPLQVKWSVPNGGVHVHRILIFFKYCQNDS